MFFCWNFLFGHNVWYERALQIVPSVELSVQNDLMVEKFAQGNIREEYAKWPHYKVIWTSLIEVIGNYLFFKTAILWIILVIIILHWLTKIQTTIIKKVGRNLPHINIPYAQLNHIMILHNAHFKIRYYVQLHWALTVFGTVLF